MKKLAQGMIHDKWMNYLTAVVVAFLLFLLLYLGIYGNLLGSKINTTHVSDLFAFWVSLIIGVQVVFMSKLTAPPRISKHLIDIMGEETDVWITGTTRFCFYLFHFDSGSQTVSTEEDEIIVEVPCADAKGKLLSTRISGVWVAGDTDIERQNFKRLKDQNEKNEVLFGNVLDRAAVRFTGSKDFWNQIHGKRDLHIEIMNDPTFKQDCMDYGIRFPSLSLMIKSGDQATDNFNAQYESELIKLQGKYPTNHKFTHEEIKEMSDLIFIKLGRAKQLVVRGGAIVRADASVN